MNRHFGALAACACIISHTGSQARCEPGDVQQGMSGVIMVMDALTVDSQALQLRYHVENSSGQDLWLCTSMDAASPTHFDAFLARDGETLVVRRRLGVPQEVATEQPKGRYARLRNGEVRAEMMSVGLPVFWRAAMADPGLPRPTTHAVRLTLEIGYYVGDLPQSIIEMLVRLYRTPQPGGTVGVANGLNVSEHIGDIRHFIMINEGLSDRNEEVLVPYTHRALTGERVLRLAVDSVSIPCSGEYEQEVIPPSLTTSTRMEIQFRPSALEFLFPYPDQQGLLDSAEKQSLAGVRTVTIDDRKVLDAVADEFALGLDDAFVVECAVAQLVCSREDEEDLSLTVGRDGSILSEGGQVFRYPPRYYARPPAMDEVRYPGNLQFLRRVALLVGAVVWRTKCAAH